MRHSIFFKLALFCTVILFNACEKDNFEITSTDQREYLAETRTQPACDEIQSIDLKTDDLSVGKIHLSASGGFLYVNIEMTDRTYSLCGADIFAGIMDNVPLDEHRNPDFERFPYRENFGLGKQNFTFVIDLDEVQIRHKCIDILVHAYVCSKLNWGNHKVAHGFGIGEVEKNVGWTKYFTYCLNEQCLPRVEECQSAFAKGQHSFLDLGVANSRLGYFIKIPRAEFEADFEKSFPIYAVGSEPTLGYGKLVGNLRVSYYSVKQTVELSFILNEGYCMSESHVTYSINEPPLKVTPGEAQISSNHLPPANSDIVRVYYKEEGDLWLIAQAFVCSFC